jgi:four helix bundle protein
VQAAQTEKGVSWELKDRKAKIEKRNSKNENWKLRTEKPNSFGVAGTAPKPPISDFKDLEVWKVARELRSAIYGLARRLPDFEKYGLAAQLRRAATSVTANIAEGYGRYSYQENAQFCRQARGSLYELRDHLTTCVDEHYLGEDNSVELERLAHRVIQLINGYIRSTLALRAAAS